MNPFLNPLTGIPFIKNWIFNPNRLQRSNPKKIEKYRDKALKKIVKYAYSVPIYNKKYKKKGVHPTDIKGIKDITKLPFISKNDLIKHYPDDIIPKGYNREKANIVDTSGSSGKKLSFFTDFPTISESSAITFRIFKYLNLNWRKSRFAIILNLNAGTVNEIGEKTFLSPAQSFFSFKNQLSINVFEPIDEIVRKLDQFGPEMIVSYPNVFQKLAFFKRKGYAKNLNPKILLVGGYLLDDYTRRYVEDSFRCKMLNIYGTAEASGDIALECMHGKWHIYHDFYHVETIDIDNEPVDTGEKGKIVITRLFGRGTPFIRYTGIDEQVILIPDYECDCGLRTPIIKNGVEGREKIVLPNGNYLSFNSYQIIPNILNNLKTFKVRQFQLIQKEVDEIEIHLIIDEDLRDIGPSVDYIFKLIREEYSKITGPGVKIITKEVDEIESADTKPTPLIISKVKKMR